MHFYKVSYCVIPLICYTKSEKYKAPAPNIITYPMPEI